jgi:hypothetical protein
LPNSPPPPLRLTGIRFLTTALSARKGEVRRGVAARLDDAAGIGLVLAPSRKESKSEEGDKEESEWMTSGSH